MRTEGGACGAYSEGERTEPQVVSYDNACGRECVHVGREEAHGRASSSGVSGGKSKPGFVKLVEFTDSGEKKGTVMAEKVVKTEAEWKQTLTPEQFEVTRKRGTEPAYTGKYWNNHEKGIYRCVCCDNALFSSDTKFESGTGWPSFWAPIAPENVRTENDLRSVWHEPRSSARSAMLTWGTCFDDGPAPTHLRYCLNSAALKFVKA